MKADIQDLKNKNPVHSVMEECAGLRFALADDGERLVSVSDPRLTVDKDAGKFFFTSKDGRDLSGDVIAWLQFEFSWSFRQCLVYLGNRAKLPEAQRTAWAGLLKPPQEKREPSDFEKKVQMNFADGQADPDDRLERLLSLRETHEAHILLQDWWGKGGFEGLLKKYHFGLVGEWSSFPNIFQRLEGSGLEYRLCAHCLGEFDGWSVGYLKQNFFQEEWEGPSVPVEGSGERAMYEAERRLFEGSQLYCVDCYEKFKRWDKGFRLLSVAMLIDERRK